MLPDDPLQRTHTAGSVWGPGRRHAVAWAYPEPSGAPEAGAVRGRAKTAPEQGERKGRRPPSARRSRPRNVAGGREDSRKHHNHMFHSGFHRCVRWPQSGGAQDHVPVGLAMVGWGEGRRRSAPAPRAHAPALAHRLLARARRPAGAEGVHPCSAGMPFAPRWRRGICMGRAHCNLEFSPGGPVQSGAVHTPVASRRTPGRGERI